MTGVGNTAPPGFSLYRDTLPPVTGVSNASHASAGDGLAELIVDLGAARISEIQVVRNGLRTCAGARHVSRGLAHGDPGADAGIEVDVAPVTVRLERESAVGAANAHDRGVAAGADDGIRADSRVVLPEDPRLGRDVRRREHPLERPQRVAFLRPLGDRAHVALARVANRLALLRVGRIGRAVGDEPRPRELGDDTLSLGHAIHGLGDDFADHGGGEVPLR
jgi:hypothetical protein